MVESGIRPHLIYLHGFASSPQSKKAQDLAARLAARGIPLHIPDLNAPDFAHLTLTAMLARVAETVRACPPGPVGLIGSSMGGLAALHFVDRYRAAEAARVSKLLLLAPAFDFAANRDRQMGADGLARWRESGWFAFHNFASGSAEPVHYGLVEDLMQYDSYGVALALPTLIVHGLHDESVPHEQSVRFAQGRPNVELRLVDSDHQLLDQTAVIWSALLAFFGV